MSIKLVSISYKAKKQDLIALNKIYQSFNENISIILYKYIEISMKNTLKLHNKIL